MSLTVQDIVPPALMVPERRLEVLVEQALTAQLSAAMFHNRATAAVSLLTDYHAGTEHIPTRTVQVRTTTSVQDSQQGCTGLLDRALPQITAAFSQHGSVQLHGCAAGRTGAAGAQRRGVARRLLSRRYAARQQLEGRHSLRVAGGACTFLPITMCP